MARVTSCYSSYPLPADEFRRRWANLRLGGVSTGMSNVLITAVPGGDRAIVGGDGVRRAASSIVLPSSSFVSERRSNLARGGARLASDAAVAARMTRDDAVAAATWTAGAARAVGGTAIDSVRGVRASVRAAWRWLTD